MKLWQATAAVLVILVPTAALAQEDGRRPQAQPAAPAARPQAAPGAPRQGPAPGAPQGQYQGQRQGQYQGQRQGPGQYRTPYQGQGQQPQVQNRGEYQGGGRYPGAPPAVQSPGQAQGRPDREYGGAPGRAPGFQGGAPDRYQNGQGRPYVGGPGYGRDDRVGGERFSYGGREFYRYRSTPYRWPRGYAPRTWGIHQILPPFFLVDQYYIDDFYDFGLSPPPYGCQWVRVGADALLVNAYTGEILDVAPGVFY